MNMCGNSVGDQEDTEQVTTIISSNWIRTHSNYFFLIAHSKPVFPLHSSSLSVSGNIPSVHSHHQSTGASSL